MKATKTSKGALSFDSLSGFGLTMVLTGIILAIGAYILTQTNTTAGFVAGSVSATTINNASAALLVIAQWLPILGLVAVAGVVIVTLVGSFSGPSRGV